MKKNGISLLLALILLLGLTACGGASSGADTAPMDAGGSMEYYGFSENSKSTADQMTSEEAERPEAGLSYPTVDSDVYQDENAKIIRRAELWVQTTAFDQSVADLAALTEANGGYYETSQVDSGGIYSQSARRSGHYVIRIPKENFISFRDGMGDVGHIYSINESTEDVGEVYYDTEARLSTLTTKRERLLELLDQAEVMEDIISLESALAEVQYEIDQHTTSLRKYDSLIDYSTFTVSLEEVVRVTQEPGPEDSFGVRLAASAKEGLADFGEWLEDTVLWLARNIIGVLCFAAVVAVVVLVVRKWLRRRKANKPQA